MMYFGTVALAAEHRSLQSIQRLKHESCLPTEVDSKSGAKPLALNRTKGERSSNSKTLAVSPSDRILELGPRRPLSTTPIFETPEELRDRVVEAFDHTRVDTTDGFGFSLLCNS